MSEPPLYEQLGQFGLFQGFSVPALIQVAGFGALQTFPAGHVLYTQGDPPRFFCLVLRGAVLEIGRNPQGETVLRRKAEAGDGLGHRALIAGQSYPATATVIQQATLLTFPVEGFHELLRLYPVLRDRLERVEIVSRLLTIPLFSRLSEKELALVADLLRVVEYPAGQTIFEQGEPADAFYVIDTGQVMESAEGLVPGGQAWPKYFAAGNFFGRYALRHLDAPRRATAVAVSDVRLFRFDAEVFQWLCERFPHLADSVDQRFDMLGTLRRVRAFAALDEAELKRLAGYVGLVHLRPGEVLVRQGQVDGTLYILYQGEALVRSRDEGGKERPRGYLKPGHVVGEAAFFRDQPCEVTVEAKSRSDWLYLTRRDFEQYRAREPKAAAKITLSQEEEYRQEEKRLKWLSPGERVILWKRRHWFYLASRLMVPLLLLPVALILIVTGVRGLEVAGGTLLVLMAMGLAWLWIDWWNDFYLLTNQRIVHREKVLLIREKREGIPLDKVQNVNVGRDLMGNLLGYGTLAIQSAAVAGAAQVRFSYLPEPDEMYDQVFQQITELRTQESALKQVELGRAEGVERRLPQPRFPRPATGSFATVSSPPPSASPTGRRTFFLELWSRWKAPSFSWPFWTEKRTDGQVTWRKHWINLLARTWVPLLLTVIVLLFLTLYLMSVERPLMGVVAVLVLCFLVGAGWWWWNFVNWGNDQYIVTEEALIDIEKLPLGLRIKQTKTTFDRVQNVNFEIPDPVATLLNYGTVVIYTAGAEGRLDFLYVPRPSQVQAEIFRRLEAYRERQRRLRQEMSWG